MIGALRGSPIWDLGAEVCLDVHGVGYVVRMTENAKKLVDGEKKILVYVHHHVREDSETLYGFASLQERELFGWLIGLQGVGPALAFSVLGSLTPFQLSEVAGNEDVDLLCSVPGVGRKTAQRIIMEMREKGDIFVKIGVQGHGDDAGGTRGENEAQAGVVEALVELGYSKTEASEMLRGAPPFVHVDDGLRWALKHGKRP